MFRSLRAYPMAVLLLPLVAAILICKRFLPEKSYSDQPAVYAFVLQGEPKATTKCERYDARLIARWDSVSGRWTKAKEEVMVYLLRDSVHPMPSAGDTIIARTIIEPFYRTYKAFAARWETHTCTSEKAVPLQKRLYDRLKEAGLSGDELATTGALTLGYKEDLDPEIKRHFQASGAAHVLAVSGLHTGILYGLVLWILTLGGRHKPLYENQLGRCALSAVIIAVMWFYAWLTGMTPSVVRAVLMVSLFEIGRMVYRQAFSLNSIAAAAVLILLVRPLDLWSVSFQLSFAATAAIVIMAKSAEGLFHRREWASVCFKRIASWLLGTIIVSVAAQLGTLPLTMYYFGQISNYFLLTNLIVLPLATLLVPCGLVTIALGGSVPCLWIGKITNGLAWAMNHSVEWIESLPGSTTQVHIGVGMVVIYYVLFIAFCVSISRKPGTE